MLIYHLKGSTIVPFVAAVQEISRQPIDRNIPEDSHYTCRRENLKYYPMTTYHLKKGTRPKPETQRRAGLYVKYLR
jgi:hypothetical protein